MPGCFGFVKIIVNEECFEIEIGFCEILQKIAIRIKEFVFVERKFVCDVVCR